MSVNEEALDDVRHRTRRRWEQKASYWHQRTKVANKFQQHLKEPATIRLLDLRSGEEVLDVACGSGVFSRRLAELGARVTAVDFAEDFLTAARTLQPESNPIEYLVADATDMESMRAIGRRRFPAAVCGMALMDMPTVVPLAESLAEILQVGARFVFSVCHPSFNHANARRTVQVVEQPDGSNRLERALHCTGYATAFTQENVGIAGSPESHLMFHRSLSELLAPFFAAGFALDGLEEPTLPADPSSTNATSWSHFDEFPPLLIGRLRLLPR